jgi:C-terminal processing protease CtpA/Prc
VVVGERTYGKGSVQNLKPFTPTGGEIKMTTGRYHPPSGRNIDKMSTAGKPDESWGVVPDVEVKLTDEQKDALEEFFRLRELITKKDPAEKAKPPVKDEQLEKALEVLKEKVKAQQDKPGKKNG